MQTFTVALSLTKEEIKLLLSRYHFKDTDFFKVEAVYQALLPLVRAEGVYVLQKQNEEIKEAEFFVVFLTLGKQVDALQDLYSENECVSEAYIIECLSLELLKKAYEKAVQQIQKESGKWVSGLKFLGDTYPLKLLPKLQQMVGNVGISYNSNFVLSPRKSVVFLMPVSKVQVKNVCHICTNCGNVNCQYRENIPEMTEETNRRIEEERKSGQRQAMPYGYQKIFGEDRMKTERKKE